MQGLKAFVGGVFTVKPVKWWNGSAWVAKPLKEWDGSQWATVSAGILGQFDFSAAEEGGLIALLEDI